MSNPRHIFGLTSLLLALATGLAAAPQQRSPAPQQRTTALRMNDQQITQLANRLTSATEALKRTMDLSAAQGSINPSRYEDNLDQLLLDFSDSAWHLRDHATRRQVIATDIDDVLNRASRFERAMQQQRPTPQVTASWRAIRRDLDQLGASYDPPWDWNNPRYDPAPASYGLYHRLTGTYQLEPARSDDPTRAINQATQSLAAAQRQRVRDNLLNRLESPAVISIDRNERQVTIASSNGPQIKFDADGQPRTEQTQNGRAMTTRADVSGDALTVSTTGTNGSDYTVTFEPLDNGQTLRVTRRLYNNNVSQPVQLRSFYRRTSEAPQWDVYSPESANIAITDGTRLVATLDRAITTRSARQGDRFTLTVTSPGQYSGATIEGTVARVNDQQTPTRADMILDLDTIRMRNSNRAADFVGYLESARTPNGEIIRVDNENAIKTLDQSQTNAAIERGAIGAAVGALIGALAGGGKGAAIGAAIGATGGAGTVLIEGRNQLDLPAGSELTIVARSIRNRT